MNILLTGASGFVGQHAVLVALARGHSVVALGRDEANARRFDWFDHVHFIKHDIHANPAPFIQALPEVDAVMHLAWQGLPDYKAAFHVNENLPADYRFLRALIQHGIRQLLVTGTCLEYGLQQGCLVEDSVMQPVTAYGEAKHRLHQQLQELQASENFVLQWARLFYMYGEGQNPKSLLPQLERALAEGASAFDMSGGEQVRDFMPVQQVADCLIRLLEHRHADGVFNVCSGKPVTVKDWVLAQLAERGASMKLNLGCYPYPDYEPMAFWGDPTALQNVLDTNDG